MVLAVSMLSYLYHNYFVRGEMGDLINLAEVIVKAQHKSAMSLPM